MSDEDRGPLPLSLLTNPQPSRGGAPIRPRPIRPFRSIRFRVLATVLTAQTALVGALVYLMLQQQSADQAQFVLHEAYLPLVLQVDQAKSEWKRVDDDIDRLLNEKRRPSLAGARSPTTFYTRRLVEILDRCERYVTLAVQPGTTDSKAQAKFLDIYLTNAREPAGDWQQSAIALADALESGRWSAEELASREASYREDAKALEDALRQLSTSVRRQIKALQSAASSQQTQANTVALTLVAVGLGLSLLMIATVSVAVSSVGRLTTQVQRLAEGEHGGLVEVGGEDEVGLLASEFNRMVRTLAVRDKTLVHRAEQLKRLSRYLANVLDSLQDGLFVVEHGIVTIANPAAERLWKVQREVAPPEAIRPLIEAPGLAEHRLGGLTVEVRVMPFGEAGLIVLTTDVTDQRRALEQLARSERLAHVGQMLAQITHEVRNPLNAMSLNAEMLTDELSDLDPQHASEAWALLDTVSTEIDRLTQVTGHYLQLARRSPAKLTPTDLADLLEDVLRLVDAELDQAGVNLITELADTPLQLVDGNQLRQAILNVIRNAVEAGAQELRLRLSTEGDQVHVALSDDGPGMDAEEIDRAFDPFFSTKATGTGLGLAITQQILEDHGGEIRAQSVKGRGTTVVLALPARPAGMSATSLGVDVSESGAH